MNDTLINIVIPMKDPAAAKQRLSQALDDRQRSRLALELFEETLYFFSNHFPQLHLLVVTDSRRIRDIADRFGHRVLLEPAADGLNSAIERATDWSLRHQFRQQLVVPADIAELDAGEIRQLLASLDGQRGVVIAEAKDLGTNALLCAPPDAIPFRFGRHSARAHQRQALKAGLPCRRLRLARLSQDIDQPQDLRHCPINPLQTDGGQARYA
ncbi:2-phospho-L-lactate guanylyltransferase [Marinobacterium arenosum]|uniref:2-phospho-L-lactate guanylyltransferase n=1 Tax=Marinobacterium arenosum TaxID=2862496 RepID=UPI001C947CB7|nr:2-phospho-L-lactate guanylyltransferase [Marinobacterium arenosum]MBY4677012.1 2-phospho-L-lactate guanylyltransferase [Marinobacterium arenosum]